MVVENDVQVKEDGNNLFDSWEDYATAQLDRIFEAVLPVSSGGGITVEYKKYVVGTHEDGTKIFDKNKVVGVKVIVDLDFDHPVKIE